MGLQTGRRLYTIGVISFIYWLLILGFALVLLAFGGNASFFYLFLGFLEPINFALNTLLGDRSVFLSSILLALVVITFALHILALILRAIDLDTPISTDDTLDMLFLIAELISVAIYIGYSVAAHRHYRWLLENEPPPYSNKDQ